MISSIIVLDRQYGALSTNTLHTPPSPNTHTHTTPVIICPPLSLVNGVVFMTSDTVGSQAIHSCNEGFTLVGDTLRECLTSGLWSKDPPTCARKL